VNKISGLACFILTLSIVVPVAADPVVIGETSTIQSRVLDEERTLMVHLPITYATSGTAYPVLYLLDARSNFHHTTGTIDALARAGHVPETIVVAIANTDRTRDLTPSPDSSVSPTAGGADKFLRFIKKELIPHVESTYRTVPFRTLVGHSFGGLFALHTLAKSPDSFDAYIAISPSLQWGDGEVAERIRSRFADVERLDKYVFMSIADEGGEMLAQISRLAEFFKYDGPAGLEWEFRPMDGDNHGSVPVRSTYHGLRRIYPRWALPSSFYAEPQLATLEKHYARLTEEYGYPILVPEVAINQIGYIILGRGELEEALELFETNVERFPESANVYDSLAEAQEQAERYEAAEANYEKAYTIGLQNDDPNTAIYKQHLDRLKAGNLD